MSRVKLLLKFLTVASAAIGGYLLAKNDGLDSDADRYPELQSIMDRHCGIPADKNKGHNFAEIPLTVPSSCIRRISGKILVGTEKGFWEFQEALLAVTEEDNRIASRWLGRIPGAKSIYDIKIERYKSISSKETYLVMRLKGGIPNSSPALLLKD